MQESTTPFNLPDAPLIGTNLIEAGAGTGKTYAITGLFLRLILEEGLSPDQILVVTFTQAATEELRERIRSALVSARAVVLQGTSGDRQLDDLVSRIGDSAGTLDRLTRALNNFDRAAIFTIHGFCQRILSENAYETGAPFDIELVTDPAPLLNVVADDFWRKHFYQAPLEWLGYALSRVSGPEVFAELLARVTSPDLMIIPEPEKPDFSDLEEYRSLFNLLKTRWPGCRDTIAGLLMNKALSGTFYGSLKTFSGSPGLSRRAVKVAALISAMDRFAAPAGIGFPLLAELEMFTQRKIDVSTRKHHHPPEHDFFSLCDHLTLVGHALQRKMERYLLFLKIKYFGDARKEIAKMKAARSVLFFDDLLEMVLKALESSSGNLLAETVRRQYHAALVDEFQDTDSIQYRIFSKLFAHKNGVFFMIGDPKQAIYSFRGADLFSYLKAARKADVRYTLTRNWRSAPGLITAVNTIFSHRRQPFVHEDIRFIDAIPAEAGADIDLPQDAASSPMVLWFLESGRIGAGNKPVNKTDAVRLIADAVSGEIARLISEKGNAPPRPCDIAVLVRTNRQAGLIKETLMAAGVPSVLYRTENIFDSREAAQMQLLLSSLANPSDSRRFRAALSTELMGVPADLFDVTASEPPLLTALSHRFDDYHREWKRRGFLRMFRTFMARERLRTRLLQYPDGERRLTNVLHLMEVIHSAVVEMDTTPAGLVKWLADQRDPKYPRLTEEPLRLESDADSVRIVTIHKCKGLEFPVVFCPFAWEGAVLRGDEILFHDPHSDDRPVLDLGSPTMEEHRNIARYELLAENARLLYVALTRARVRCYLVWGRINTAETSALAYLFHGRDDGTGDIFDGLTSLFREKSDHDLLSDMKRLVQRAGNTLEVMNLPAKADLPGVHEAVSPPALFWRSFGGKIRTPWKISSYSSLVSQKKQGEDAPDRDAPSSHFIPLMVKGSDGAGRDIFSFPKGARAGTFFHELLEHLDFTNGDESYRSGLIRDKLATYGFESSWLAPVSETMSRILSTPLMSDRPEFLLSAVDWNSRINEMEFYYPIKRISPAALRQAFSTNRNGNALDRFPEMMDKLTFRPHEGVMKGFIDLVFRFSNRFYLVDWKSNYLGSGLEDYRRASIREAMAETFYFLQYHLYVVALDRYLSLRKNNYDYRTDFGGVFYIFIRGMDPDKGPSTGIFYDRPDPSLIKRLVDTLIPGIEGAAQR